MLTLTDAAADGVSADASKVSPLLIADRLITLGFLDEVLQRMTPRALADHVRRRLVASLDEAEAAEEAASAAGGPGGPTANPSGAQA